MDLSDEPAVDEPEGAKPGGGEPAARTNAPEPDTVTATFHAWLDHVLACGHCYGGGPTTARLCYHSEHLGDRHREAGRAARHEC